MHCTKNEEIRNGKLCFLCSDISSFCLGRSLFTDYCFYLGLSLNGWCLLKGHTYLNKPSSMFEYAWPFGRHKTLNLSWRRSLSYRNQAIELQSLLFWQISISINLIILINVNLSIKRSGKQFFLEIKTCEPFLRTSLDLISKIEVLIKTISSSNYFVSRWFFTWWCL